MNVCIPPILRKLKISAHVPQFMLFLAINIFEEVCYINTIPKDIIAPPHKLVRATNVRFLPTGVTFRVGLVSENHWIQLVLVLTIH